jgi:hypothetical protein
VQVVDADAAVLIWALKTHKAYRLAVSLSQLGDTKPRLQAYQTSPGDHAPSPPGWLNDQPTPQAAE